MVIPIDERGREPHLLPRLLIIGIDGATLDLIGPWIKAGELPHLGRLFRHGAFGTLTSTTPPNSAAAWTSFMTGKNPGKHGIFDFFEPIPGSYAIRHTNGSSRRSRTIWSILSESGVRVGVMGVPMTYPPEQVAGYLIAGLDAPDERSQFISPPQLQQDLLRKFGRLDTIVYHFPQRLGRTYRSAHRALTLWEQLEERRMRVCKHLIRTHPTDLVMIHFFAVDQIQHYFWHFMDRTHPLHDPEGAPLLGGAIKRIYHKMDDLVGELLGCLPTECTVIVLSDHGAGPLHRGPKSVNEFLRSLGLLKFKETDRLHGAMRSLGHRTLKKTDRFLRSLLPSGAKTWLSWAFPDARSAFESYIAAGKIDWEATKAYCYGDYSPGIWINLKGLWPQGIVEPGADYENLLTFITKKLYEIRDPETGAQMIPRVRRREEMYSGPYINNAPDLLIDSWAEAPPVAGETPSAKTPARDGARGGPTRGTIGVKTASHRYNGILLLKGDAFKAGEFPGGAQIIDLAPTILYLMGVPVPNDMDGRVLTEVLTDEHLGRNPVAYGKGNDNR